MQFIFFCHIERNRLFDFVVQSNSSIRSAFKHQDLNTVCIQDDCEYQDNAKKKNSKLHTHEML